MVRNRIKTEAVVVEAVNCRQWSAHLMHPLDANTKVFVEVLRGKIMQCAC